MLFHSRCRPCWWLSVCLAFLSLQLSVIFSNAQGARVRRPLTEEYLYYNLTDGKSAYPIIEYTVKHTDPDQMPPFVEKSYKDHRVVIYYSPRCPHCIHYVPTYLGFARQFQNLTNQDTLYAGLDVKFYAVSCLRYKKVCRKQKVSAYPTLRVYTGSTTDTTVLKGGDLHPLTVIKALGERVVNDQWTGDHDKTTTAKSSTTASQYFMPRTQPQIFGDASLTFYNALKDSVFLEDGPLSQKRQMALKQWLHLLEKVLPPWRLNWVVAELLEDFKGNVESENQWTSVLDHFPPRQTMWSPACEIHESPYTCGLWTLLHIVTVGVVEYNRGVVRGEGTTDKGFSLKLTNVNSVSIFVREYVHHFFLCEECSTHFVQAFDQCEYNRCNRLTHTDYTLEEWRELPLWLLNFHNGVNIRLQQERFEREGRAEAPTVEEEQAVMWPPVKECPTCWTHLEGAKSEYDSEKMYDFMRMSYWPEDGASSATRRQVNAAIAEYEQNPNMHATNQRRTNTQNKQGSSVAGIPPKLMGDDMTVEAPYLLVGAAVFGVWVVVFWRKCHMDRLLGIHRSKMRTV